VTNYIVGVLTGIVMGASTVIYIVSITKTVEVKKRLKIIGWVGIPLGIIMSVIAQFIGRNML
jgi:multisubunit Na+/H+ antiporter MnhB subunit